MKSGQNLMKDSAKSFWRKKNRITVLYIIGIVFLIMATFAGIVWGSTKVNLSEVFGAIREGDYTSVSARIFAYVRLPRTLASLVCGAALSVSGVVIQGVLANRLASPSIIGVNAGAGLAVTICTAMGIYGGFQMSLFAFAGAFTVVVLVSSGAKKWGASRGTVILIGVAVNSLLGAISDTIITFIPDVGVMSNDFKVGEFSAVTYQKVIPATIIILIAMLILFTIHNELDVFTLGEESATSLGMNPAVVRTMFLVLAAFLAGAAVSLAGLLSFVGLLIPHVIRRIGGNKSLHVLALSGIYGAGFVCLCDAIARTAFSPYEIPVGIMMAFFGAPFFVFILVKGKGGHKND